MTRLLLGLVLAASLVGCAAPAPPSDSSTVALPSADAALVPIARVRAGRVDTVAIALSDATFGSASGVEVRDLGGGLVAVTTGAGWPGVSLVPFRAGGEEAALAVASTAPPGLQLRLVGVAADDPSLLEFSLRRPDGAPFEIDEEEGVVALLGDRAFGDNAIDAFDDYVFLDLDAAGAGRQTLRLAARADGLVSNWLAVEVEDGRFVREVQPRFAGR